MRVLLSQLSAQVEQQNQRPMKNTQLVRHMGVGNLKHSEQVMVMAHLHCFKVLPLLFYHHAIGVFLDLHILLNSYYPLFVCDSLSPKVIL